MKGQTRKKSTQKMQQVTQTSKKSGQKPKTTSSKKTSKLSKKTPAKKAGERQKSVDVKVDSMDDFQQCIVLAAIINQQRQADPRFISVPLPDINSPALAPLRECIGKYHFNAHDITAATEDT